MEAGKIIKSKRGHPFKPNMVKKLIKVDEILYTQLRQKAIEEHTTIANLLSKDLKFVLAEG